VRERWWVHIYIYNNDQLSSMLLYSRPAGGQIVAMSQMSKMWYPKTDPKNSSQQHLCGMRREAISSELFRYLLNAEY